MEIILKNRLINVGYGNVINADKLIAVISSDSAPARRKIQNSKEEGLAVDATQGRKTKSLLVMENGIIILSALTPDTITSRINDNGEVMIKGENDEER